MNDLTSKLSSLTTSFDASQATIKQQADQLEQVRNDVIHWLTFLQLNQINAEKEAKYIRDTTEKDKQLAEEQQKVPK